MLEESAPRVENTDISPTHSVSNALGTVPRVAVCSRQRGPGGEALQDVIRVKTTTTGATYAPAFFSNVLSLITYHIY